MWKILLSIFIFGAIVGPLIAVAVGAAALAAAAALAVVAMGCALLWAGTKGVWRWAQTQPAAGSDAPQRAPVPPGLPLVAPRYPRQQVTDVAAAAGPDGQGGGGAVSLFDQYRQRHQRHQGRLAGMGVGGVGRALVLDTRAYGRPERP
ncbi:hypothetical protein E3G45_005034 [Mycobacteroides abscessus]|uniref:hypothetical protein n=1 Tax=Mycobacteroides abscessus TaxID=36809 RepID=UPI001877854B|nr:hypothetical protein [Mycobacteroides abscessus]